MTITYTFEKLILISFLVFTFLTILFWILAGVSDSNVAEDVFNKLSLGCGTAALTLLFAWSGYMIMYS